MKSRWLVVALIAVVLALCTYWLVTSLTNDYRISRKYEWVTVQARAYRPPSTTLMPMRVGKTTMLMPQYHAERYVITVVGDGSDDIFDIDITAESFAAVEVGHHIRNPLFGGAKNDE